MEIDLHPAVRDLFVSQAHHATIYSNAAQHYSREQQDMLPCFAVYYGHKRYAKIHSPFKQPSKFNALITAIYERAYEFIPWVAAHVQDLSYYEGYGKIRNDRLIMDKPVTVWEAIFDMDDPKSLVMLQKFCHCEPSTLAHLARESGARHCYEIITNTSWQPARFWLCAIRHALRVFLKKKIKWRAYRDNPVKLHLALFCRASAEGKITVLMRMDTLLLWKALITPRKRRFLTPTDEAKIEELLTGNLNELVQYCQQECEDSNSNIIPDIHVPDWISTLDLHTKVILECWHVILEHSTINGLLKDSELVSELQQRMQRPFAQALERFPFVRTDPPYQKFLFLLNTMTKMFMQVGGRFDNWYAWGAMRWWQIECPNVKHTDHCLVHRLLHDHVMTRIAHDYKHINFSLFTNTDLHFEEPIDIMLFDDTIMSILPQAIHETFRLASRNETHAAPRDVYTPELKAPRSLLELCRITVHQSLPGHKLPQIVHGLHIPQTLKHFLSLGVTPVP